jgi:hypothetical protein
MDKIRLSSADVDFLFKWRDEHIDLVLMATCPKKALKFVFYEKGLSFTSVRNNNEITFVMNYRGISKGKVVLRRMPTGFYSLVTNKTELTEEYIQDLLGIYVAAMAFLVFGSETHELAAEESAEEQDIAPEQETKSKSSSKKNVKKSSSGVTYILHQRTHKSGSKGHHRPISCEFSVRGHFRHYKSGKTVWIAEYRKGTGKKKDKVYRVGA